MTEHKELAGQLRVKPLVWEEPDGPDGRAWLGHGTEICQYYIRLQADAYWLPGDDDDAEEYPTLEAAKAAAQADYEARILSALERPSPPEGVLTRYDLSLGDVGSTMEKADDGEWVRYEEAAGIVSYERAATDMVARAAHQTAQKNAALLATKEAALVEANARAETLAGLYAAEGRKNLVLTEELDRLKAASERMAAALKEMKANAAFNVTDRVDRALVVGDIDAALNDQPAGEG